MADEWLVAIDQWKSGASAPRYSRPHLWLQPSFPTYNQATFRLSPYLIEKLVSYRTAAILTAVLVAGIFVLPNITWAVFLPALKQGLDPIPGYERLLLDFTVFCDTWRFPFALPILAAPLSFAALSGKSRAS